MGAYNKFDGAYCCASKKLLTDILRDEWGFDGFVMSDFVNGVHNAEDSLKAGLDVEMMFTMHYNAFAIKKLLKSGKLQQEHIDRAVRNILRVLIRQVPQIRPRSKSVVASKKHRDLALEIAEKGMVLLENNGVLPLSKDTRVMVTGPYADEANVGDQGSSRVWDKNIVTPFAGISKVFPNASLTEGDVAVVCVGSNRKKEGEFFASASEKMKKKPRDCGGDRDSLRLEAGEVELIKSLKAQGKKVVIGAADTFRAAAVEQLTIWAERAGVDIVKQAMGSDPASVAFDTVNSAVAKGADVVLIDTAGRLHNRIDLMNELTKIRNVIRRVVPDGPHEVLLVLDGSTGQNAFVQAKEFSRATDVTALAVTKLDGSAKGGVVVGIVDQFRFPIKFLGIGEGIDDLKVFDKKEYVNSLFKKEDIE